MCWCCLIKDAVHGNKWVLLTLPFLSPLDVQWEPVAEIRRVRTADAGGACVLAEAPANRRTPVEGGHVLTPFPLTECLATRAPVERGPRLCSQGGSGDPELPRPAGARPPPSAPAADTPFTPGSLG